MSVVICIHFLFQIVKKLYFDNSVILVIFPLKINSKILNIIEKEFHLTSVMHTVNIFNRFLNYIFEYFLTEVYMATLFF